jgi:hypothetical protein
MIDKLRINENHSISGQLDRELPQLAVTIRQIYISTGHKDHGGQSPEAVLR